MHDMQRLLRALEGARSLLSVAGSQTAAVSGISHCRIPALWDAGRNRRRPSHVLFGLLNGAAIRSLQPTDWHVKPH